MQICLYDNSKLSKFDCPLRISITHCKMLPKCATNEKNLELSILILIIVNQIDQPSLITIIIVSSMLRTDSKILTIDQENYLLHQLNNPTDLKLLFRASQHNFASAKFHQYCNGKRNTVTILRNEFGKTIAAYTPLEWNSTNDFFADQSKSSFLLQLDQKQKLTLTQPENAIKNHKNYGPTFGDGHDLVISDQCNKYLYSACFFSSYSNPKYQNNQQGWNAFCGSINGYNFRVIEYEVFAVLRD